MLKVAEEIHIIYLCQFLEDRPRKLAPLSRCPVS
jgi:hypothetical protein